MKAIPGQIRTKRDREDWEHFRPSRQGTRGVVSYIPPELHAALVAWAEAHGMSLVELTSGALAEWAAEQGVTLEDGAKSA